ncbi:cathepsin L [Caerostris darwini]|uniref:Cathepsin L n=1 Tax=Caerostris darwini TaxID=1538125 RepID=A0AAV4UNF2_9ARAC|nr:cathepsin L [Caerostris darwini]
MDLAVQILGSERRSYNYLNYLLLNSINRTNMKPFIFLALLSVASCKSIDLFDSQLDDLWESFKNIFTKSYDVREETTRRFILENKIAEISRHNLEADLGLRTWTKGLNKYSDMSPEEQRTSLLGYKLPKDFVSQASSWLPPMHAVVPERMDWRDHGFVTPVKNQGKCGSCWAFAATGSLEGQHARKTGKLVSLSEQNLVDCAKGNEGCGGGYVSLAFHYIKNNKGIDTEVSYPYAAKNEKCHFKNSTVGATCTGYVVLPKGEEEALKVAVATIGPISVSMDAAVDIFDYKNGIYDSNKCKNDAESLNHAVLAVGYGTENGKDYWLVKNSWGTSWGENGYIKMARNNHNMCGIALRAKYPLV